MNTLGNSKVSADIRVRDRRRTFTCRRAERSDCLWFWLMDRRKGKAPFPRGYVRSKRSSKNFVAILGVILLSVVDAMLTLFLVSCGATEMNPLMAYFLDHGPLTFFWAKYLLTCIPLIFVLLHEGVTLFGTGAKAQVLFVWIPLPFALVVFWELYLVFCVL